MVVIQCVMLVESELVSIEEALKKKVWMEDMKEELEAIERNKTSELTELPNNKKSISLRRVYKLKLKADGSVDKHKTRLVVRGFLHNSGLDYLKVFAHVARHETIRLVIDVAANRN
ncbi:uncharacterized mitochondrial protein AtMg00820-like [Lathyrus oleraceus]|uniref:uncharacterized mitochondrial protein AtMg00820-like n=1 Tax=Pisum sativum TaxID=3888 RepID=UPI0021D28A91|nr:uncharacterized mitochondrial protein AtMg00820-like [Pisum sativum]